jgi:uncharacterized membrane protein YdbT with pleckstrin-like domain
MPEAPSVLRPRKSTFIGTRVVGYGFLLGVLGLVSLVASRLGDLPELLLGALLSALFFALACVSAVVAYRKERYEFSATKIRCERGGLFSSQITDLEVRNITHVKLHLPWLRWRFFGVGNVLIESAGSASSEIILRLIQDPEAVRDQVRELMKTNGFSLQRNELLHEESPATTGVALDCLAMGLSAVFGVLLIVGEILPRRLWEEIAGYIPWWGLPLPVLLVVSGLVWLVLHWFDLSRRTYRVFEDCVEYEEGFLTRTNCFLPGENIADSSTNRNFIDRLLGLYSVSISCQGSGSEIRFRRLKRGEELSKTIDRLVEQLAGAREILADPAQRSPGRADGPSQLSSSRDPNDSPDVSPATRLKDAWTAELQMDPRRALVPLLFLFPAFPVWVLASITTFIRTQTTRFSVRANSVRWTFKFLAVRQREFSYDKITGVVVIRNPWDRLFDTATIRLWSIGSGQPMDLRHIRCSELDIEALLKQAGIPRSVCRHAAPTQFGVRAWVLGHLPLLATAAAIGVALGVLIFTTHIAFFLGLIPVAGILFLVFLVDALWCRSQSLRFFDEHLEAETGILVQHHTYIAFADVKKVVLTRFPSCDIGRVEFCAAGENLGGGAASGGAGGQGSGKGLSARPYGVILRFLGDLNRWHTELDGMLERPQEAGAPAVGSLVLRASQPALANSLVPLLLGSIILVPLIALLPLTLPWTIVSVRRRHYRIEAGRVVCESGVIYRRHESVLWSRIDALLSNKGLLNTMLGNGSITLLTAGSSKPDLVLSALPDCDDFYAQLLDQYGGN